MSLDDQSIEFNTDERTIEFELDSQDTVRGVFICSKPKQQLILRGVGMLFSAICVFVGVHCVSLVGMVAASAAFAYFFFTFLDELRKYLRPTRGTLWSTATFDEQLEVKNGDTLTCNYTIDANTEEPYLTWRKRLMFGLNPWANGSKSKPIKGVEFAPSVAVMVDDPPLYEPCPILEGNYNWTEAFNPFRDEVLEFLEFLINNLVRPSELGRIGYVTDKRHIEAVLKVFPPNKFPGPPRLYGLILVEGVDRWEPRAKPWVEREDNDQ